MIPGKKFFISSCFFSIERDIFLTHHFVKKTFRGFPEKLGQIFVKTLSCFIFINDKFLHYKCSYRQIARIVCLISSSLERSGYRSSGVNLIPLLKDSLCSFIESRRS